MRRPAVTVCERDLELAGLVYAVDGQGNTVHLGEQIRALATMVGAERDRAAHLNLAKLGLDIATVRSATVAKQARQMVTLTQALCEEGAWTGPTMPLGATCGASAAGSWVAGGAGSRLG